MVDSGATQSFIRSSFVIRIGWIPEPLASPLALRWADGKKPSAGALTHGVHVLLALREDPALGADTPVKLFVTHTGRHVLILGKPWLITMNPNIDWAKRTLTLPPTCSPSPSVVAVAVEAAALAHTPGWLTGLEELLLNTAEAGVHDQDDHDSTVNLSSLPSHYKDYADVFSKADAAKLPPHWPHDLSINLKPGTHPPFGPLY